MTADLLAIVVRPPTLAGAGRVGRIYETATSHGKAESPVYVGIDFEFDAGTGLPIDRLRAAIAEFLATALTSTARPTRPRRTVLKGVTVRITASWLVYGGARAVERTIDVNDAGDIDILLKALAGPEASDAKLQHSARPPVEFEGELLDDYDVTVGVHDGFGHLAYWDIRHPFAVSVGAAESPSYIAHYFEFGAGSGISIETLRSAIEEFLATATRPTGIYWRPYP